MSIIATLWIFWIAYIAFRLSFNKNYKKQEYGAIFTLRIAGFMGLLIALEGVLYHFHKINLKLFFGDFQYIIILISISVLLFCIYKDTHLLKKAGQKIFTDKNKKSTFMLFTWDIWIVSIVIVITLVTMKSA